MMLAGCEDTFISISSDGRLNVVISTSGPGSDVDGFSIIVDADQATFQTRGGTVGLTGLSPGTHSVLLDGVAANCVVDGANPRTVSVGTDGTAQVAFSVRCERATTGALTIVVGTTGEPGDPDGYRLVVDGGGIRRIGASASETFAGLAEGVHLVMLKDVANGCAVQGGNPQPLTVAAGMTVRAGLVVSCGPVPR